jgi:hypothetical protein
VAAPFGERPEGKTMDLTMQDRTRTTDKDSEVAHWLTQVIHDINAWQQRVELPYANDLSMRLMRLRSMVEDIVDGLVAEEVEDGPGRDPFPVDGQYTTEGVNLADLNAMIAEDNARIADGLEG